VRNGTALSLKSEFKALRAALRSLDGTLQKVIATNGAATRPHTRPRLSPKARASLVLQGRYMGFMRQLKPRQKERVRKVKAGKGVRAAIATARRLSA
jgi:hypothetical protein